MKKLLFIYNPKAGKTQIRNNLSDIIEILSRKYEVIVYPTQKEKNAMDIINETKETYNLIVCAGGDGTLDEVASAIVSNNMSTPIGYIPCGSTNDIANSIGLSKNLTKSTKYPRLYRRWDVSANDFV